MYPNAPYQPFGQQNMGYAPPPMPPQGGLLAAMQQTQGPSPGQINSFKFLYNSATPKDRQQMLQNAHPAFQQAVQDTPLNAPQQNQVQGNSFTTNLTNYALNGGIAGTLYNNFVKPIGQNVANVGNDLYQSQFTLPQAQRDAQAQNNSLDQYQQQVQQQFNQGRINQQQYSRYLNSVQSQRQGISDDLNKTVQQAPTTGQAVNDIGQFGVNLASAGIGGASPEISAATKLAAMRAGLGVGDFAGSSTMRALPAVLSGQAVTGIPGAMLRGGAINAGFGAASGGIQAGANNQNIAMGALQGAGQGYAMGAGLGAVGHMAAGAGPAVGDGARAVGREIKAGNERLGERGAIGGSGAPIEPMPTGEQIGRLKAQINSEPDPNVKVELAGQLRDLNTKYAAEKTQAKIAADRGTSDPSEMAKTLGIDPNTQPKLKITPEEGMARKNADMAKIDDGLSGIKPGDIKNQKARMEAMNAPTKNQVDLAPGEGDIKSAIANSQQVSYAMGRKANSVNRAAKGLTEESRQLANHYEYGKSIDEVANMATSPKQRERLADALTKLEDYYDYKLAAERAAGAQIPKVGQYGRHFWDLSNKTDAERFNQFAGQQGTSKFNGTSNQPRIFRTYAEGEALGFKRQNSDIFKDATKDANMSTYRIEHAALKEGVIRAGGEEVSQKGQGRDANGKPFVNSNISGLNGLSYSKRIADELKGYNPLDRNIFGKSFDKLNAFQKNVILSLSLFHSMNISLNFVGAEAFRHPFIAAKGFGQSAVAFVSPKYYEHVMSGFDKRGVTEWAGKNGIALGTNHDISPEGVKAKIGSSPLNLITQGHKAIFEREIPIMTLHMAEIGKKAGIVPGSVEGIKYGQEINNIMGLLNQKILSRDPNTQKWLNRVMLAPAFTETKYRALGDAALKWGGDNQKAGNLARQAVVGKTAMAGIVGIVGSIVATGQFPTVQQAISQFSDPNIETDIKNKAGGTKSAFLPHTFTSELSDPVGKLLHGDTSGVIHYANARLSPNLSVTNKLLTNQDYFGNPIFDPNKPVAGQLAGEAVKQVMPIGVQNATDLATGKKGLAETALNEAGFRVKNDPNNPINQQSAQFFKGRDAALAGMTPNQKADFNSINPSSKNPDGSYTPESSFNPFKSPQKVLTLLKDPAVLDATVKLNQSQSNHDPMWDLPSDQLKTFLTYQGIQGTDYNSATAKEIKSQNPWINDLNTQRSTWFATLPPSKNPDGQNPLKYPNMSPDSQQAMDTYTSITDPKQKAAFMQSHPELQQQFDAMNQYTNDRRTQEGVPQFAQRPVASPQVQAMMNAGNFRDPQVQQFLNATSAFKIAGPFGDGIGGGGGGSNTSQLAIANVAQGLQANGKPSPYAQNAARNATASRNRSLRNSMKYANKAARKTLQKGQQRLGVSNFIQPHYQASQNQNMSHLAKALAGVKHPQSRKA